MNNITNMDDSRTPNQGRRSRSALEGNRRSKTYIEKEKNKRNLPLEILIAKPKKEEPMN